MEPQIDPDSQIDPDFRRHACSLLDGLQSVARPPVHDVESRIQLMQSMAGILSTPPIKKPWKVTKYSTTASDGACVDLYFYHIATESNASTHGPAILHLHGGGMISGQVSDFDKQLGFYVTNTLVPMLSVEYRLEGSTSMVQDCYAGLQWLHEHAEQLHIDRRRIAVMGDSAGGGLSAGLALLSRDRQVCPSIAKQILIYPMLDDRNIQPGGDPPYAIWTKDDNITAWSYVLGEDAGADKAPVYCAPARALNLFGLPNAYVEVGGLDLFRDEAIDYAGRLAKAGADVELHVHQGVPHAFDWIAPGCDVAKKAFARRFAAITSF